MTPPSVLVACDSTDLAADSCGAKAARLGVLIGRGFRVPPFAVLPTTTCDRVVEAAGLRPWVERILPELATASPERLAAIESEAHDRLVDTSFDDSVLGAVSDWVARQPTQSFAVRSSATMEDLPGASFAGMYSSYVSVETAAVSRAIRQCLASLFTARAAFYRRRKHLTGAGRMAVIVQHMVASDLAGVVFTRAPRRPDALVVEIAPGLCDGVVSGNVAPNRYHLNRTDLAIADRLEHQEIEPAVIQRIAQTALDIESLHGEPQDVEFGIAHEVLSIFQCRPITRPH